MIKHISKTFGRNRPLFDEVGTYYKNKLIKSILNTKGDKSKVSENGLIYVLVVDNYIKYIGESKDTVDLLMPQKQQ